MADALLIFEKFVHLEEDAERKYRSTGLGLTFCKMAIEAHHGEIGVRSEEGKGTTFWVNLPEAWEDIHILPTLPAKEVSSLSSQLLDEESQQILKPFYESLAELAVYYVSDVQNVLAQINFEQTPSLQLWRDALTHTLENMNQTQYENLLAQIQK